MTWLNNILKIIKNLFNKKEVKQIEEMKEDKKEENSFENQRGEFLTSLKSSYVGGKKKGKVEVRICEGDGLGIQKKMTC